MKQNMIVWTYRVGFFAVVAGMAVGTYGCSLETEGCGGSLICPKPSSAIGPVMVILENCQNGNDDDKNGLADCEDPVCANLLLCNVREDGWQYHTITTDVYAAKAIPDCADGNKAERLYEGHNGQPSCEACTCSKANPQASLTCDGLPELECTTDFQDENTTWTSITTESDSSCQIPAGLDSISYCRLQGTVNVASNSCIAGGGGLVDAPAWTNDVFSCPLAPDARADDAGICLRQDGDIATCPDGYGQRTVVYKSEAGTRACTACNCTGECAARIVVYENGNCQGNAVPLTSGQQREVETMVSDGMYSIRKVAPTPPADCLPSGGELVEMVQPAEPVTICCK
jgi:hypothetical protein